MLNEVNLKQGINASQKLQERESMNQFNTLNIGAGLTAYVVAVLFGTGPVVYLAYRFNIGLTRKEDEEAMLLAGKRSVGIYLGAILVCQAILIRHAVPTMMEAIRTLFVYEIPGKEAWALGLRSLLFGLILVGFALFSVRFAGGLFTFLTRKINEKDEILKKDNVAVALFHALVLLAITIILNEGVEDLARSFVPLARTGF